VRPEKREVSETKIRGKIAHRGRKEGAKRGERSLGRRGFARKEIYLRREWKSESFWGGKKNRTC